LDVKRAKYIRVTETLQILLLIKAWCNHTNQSSSYLLTTSYDIIACRQQSPAGRRAWMDGRLSHQDY